MAPYLTQGCDLRGGSLEKLLITSMVDNCIHPHM